MSSIASHFALADLSAQNQPSQALKDAFLQAASSWSASAKVRFSIQGEEGHQRHMLSLKGRGEQVIFCQNLASGNVYRLNQPRPEAIHWSDRAKMARKKA